MSNDTGLVSAPEHGEQVTCVIKLEGNPLALAGDHKQTARQWHVAECTHTSSTRVDAVASNRNQINHLLSKQYAASIKTRGGVWNRLIIFLIQVIWALGMPLIN